MQARNTFEYIDVFFRYMVSSRKICGVLSANGKRPVEGDHIYNNEDDDDTTIWYNAFFTFSLYILFYSGLLRREWETDLNVMYVSASQCVIIKPCGSQLSYDMTAHTCDLL